ncbi:MAG: serine/threonine-protein kinase [Polyangiaceae bacterium]
MADGADTEADVLSPSERALLAQVLDARPVDPATRLEALLGTRVGRYRLEEILGAGGMGAVYRATDLEARTHVALKLLHPAALGGKDERQYLEFRKRFRGESRRGLMVAHPGVARVYDAGEVDGHLFIAMELIEGYTLRREIRRAQGPEIKRRLEILRQVADVLAAVHLQNLVHRDIKPDNIMVAAHGGVKLLDFGLARFTKSPARELQGASDWTTQVATRGGVILGTPHYMAPEQVLGQRSTPAADIFALGITAFELLSGERPFRGANSMHVMLAIARDEALRLVDVFPEATPELGELVAGCLRKDPLERPSAEALERQLAAVELS